MFLRNALVAGGLALLGLACGTAAPTASVSSAEAAPAPDFGMRFLDDDLGDSLADLRGRVVLIEFWRTW